MMTYETPVYGSNYSYVEAHNDEVIKDLEKDPISVYIRSNKSKVSQYQYGFAAVVTVRNQQDAFYVEGSNEYTPKSNYISVRRRSNLRALLKALQLIHNNSKTCAVKIYVSDLYIIRFLERDWGLLWKNKGYKRPNGKAPKNMDLIKPLAELLYTEGFKECIKAVYDADELGREETYAEKRAIRMANEKSKGFVSDGYKTAA